jgi:hypothetical protein
LEIHISENLALEIEKRKAKREPFVSDEANFNYRRFYETLVSQSVIAPTNTHHHRCTVRLFSSVYLSKSRSTQLNENRQRFFLFNETNQFGEFVGSC